jgi:Inhibitor of growth proteins N-terminal histone-binding
MAEYLKKYVDRVGDVPAQLHRLFALIRDLDQRVAKLQDDVEEKCRQQLAARAGRGEAQLTKRQRTAAAGGEDAALAAEIEAGMQKLVSLSEEKVRGAHGKRLSCASASLTAGCCCRRPGAK